MRLLSIALFAAAMAGATIGPAKAGTVTCSGAACAGSFAGAVYATAHCPAPPTAPTLRGGKENYAHSVELAKAYSDAAVARMNCIQDEANNDAEALQKAIKTGVKAQQDDAQAKLSAVQTSLNNLSQH